MALTTCPECAHQVSESALTCPNCGHPLTGQRSEVARSFAASTPLIIAIVAAAGITIGSLLPWFSLTTIFGTLSASGMEGDGVFTLIAGILLGIVAVVALSRNAVSRLTAILIGLLGLISGLIAFNVFSNLSGVADFSDAGLFSSIGAGLWLVIIGSAAAVGLALPIYSLATAEGRDGVAAKPWTGVGVGVAVAIAVVIALALSNQGQANPGSDLVEDIFPEIPSGREP